MTDLENQLRYWVPRRPSARLERRLFGSRQEGAESEAGTAASFRMGWLAPATAALVALCVLYSQRDSSSLSGPGDSNGMVAMISSNRSDSLVSNIVESSTTSAPGAEKFEWTNGSSLTSSITSLSAARGTN